MEKEEKFLTVKYVGFGGIGDHPCYEDDNKNVYFDLNNGTGELYLHTGAYREEDGNIWGEPCDLVEVPVVCEHPYIKGQPEPNIEEKPKQTLTSVKKQIFKMHETKECNTIPGEVKKSEQSDENCR